MGFGKKKDPVTNRTIDLDITYNKLIRPAVESAGCMCIRADEILESGYIDKSMYALLYSADIVIADISTYNPNAIYELGVRHALRPNSTIIIKEDKGNIPFDINHNKIMSYTHLGTHIVEAEIEEFVPKLKELIQYSITNGFKTDSPLYTFFPAAKRIELPVEEISDITTSRIIMINNNNGTSIFNLTERAKNEMKQNHFEEAERIWEKLCSIVKDDKYYIQQRALCHYKSKMPSELQAYTDALQIMAEIKDETDTESLGIRGAINKRLWELTKEIAFLDSAIDSYKKSWNLYEDYYTGENYAVCVHLKSTIEERDEVKTYYQVECKLTCQKIISMLLPLFEDKELNGIFWEAATLSNAYLGLGDGAKAEKYENIFRGHNPLQWEIDTFENNKSLLKY